MCAYAFVHLCNLICGLTVRFEFLDGLPHNERPCKRHTVNETNRTDFDAQGSNGLRGISSLAALCTSSVHNDENRFIRCFYEVERVGDGFQIKNCRPTRYQDQIGISRSLKRGAVQMRSSIEDEDATSCLFNPFFLVLESAGVSRENDWQLLLSSISPFRGRSLRVEVNDSSIMSGSGPSYGQVDRKSRFPSATFLVDYGEGFHAYIRIKCSFLHNITISRSHNCTCARVGVDSADQFREMRKSGVRLVVPAELWKHYPQDIRPELTTLENFFQPLAGSISLGLPEPLNHSHALSIVVAISFLLTLTVELAGDKIMFYVLEKRDSRWHTGLSRQRYLWCVLL